MKVSVVVGLILIAWMLSGCFGQMSAAQPGVRADRSDLDTSQVPDQTIYPAVPTQRSPSFNPIDGMQLVFVPAGEFEMGADAEAGYAICQQESANCLIEDFSDEAPAHTVSLKEFWIYRTEVTNQVYRRCVEEGSCEKPAIPEFFQEELFSDHPVVYVDWYSAEAYCAWAGGRLPTEAEWEKAARGTDARSFPWGEKAKCGFGNYKGCSQGLTMPAGSFPAGASPYGALDMAGNAAEWVADWYSADYYKDTDIQDPQGPYFGELRVARGGSWKNPITAVRTTNRTANLPQVYSSGVSFRCVLEINQ